MKPVPEVFDIHGLFVICDYRLYLGKIQTRSLHDLHKARLFDGGDDMIRHLPASDCRH